MIAMHLQKKKKKKLGALAYRFLHTHTDGGVDLMFKSDNLSSYFPVFSLILLEITLEIN